MTQTVTRCRQVLEAGFSSPAGLVLKELRVGFQGVQFGLVQMSASPSYDDGGGLALVNFPFC
jgi:hypothetical protein